jgi:hypothetical protein
LATTDTLNTVTLDYGVTGERHGIGLHVLQEELTRRFPILIKLNPAIGSV